MRMTLRNARSNFFDRKLVKDGMNLATWKVLSRLGAFIMRRAQTSMRWAAKPGRKKKKGAWQPSLPGTPPKARVGYLRKFLYFAWDRSTRSMVVGPVKLSASSKVPELHEFGGTLLRRKKRKNTKGYKVRPRAKYPARPYMRPALWIEMAKLPPRWRNTFTARAGSTGPPGGIL